jgi:DNA-binding transcriptional MocR family regulator
LAAAALARGIGVHSGKICYATDPRSGFLRVCYSFVSPEQIDRGIALLGTAYASVARAT